MKRGLDGECALEERQLIYALERRVTLLEQMVEKLSADQKDLLASLQNTSRSSLPDRAVTLIADGHNPVKTIRQSRLLTQQQLAELSGVGVNYISRIENGGGFGLQTAQRLAVALRVRVEDLASSVAKIA